MLIFVNICCLNVLREILPSCLSAYLHLPIRYFLNKSLESSCCLFDWPPLSPSPVLTLPVKLKCPRAHVSCLSLGWLVAGVPVQAKYQRVTCFVSYVFHGWGKVKECEWLRWLREDVKLQEGLVGSKPQRYVWHCRRACHSEEPWDRR